MKILLNGANGHMGSIVQHYIEASEDMQLAARVDAFSQDGCLSALKDFDGEADCLIDFSHHNSTETVTEYITSSGIPAVIATTGQTDDERGMIAKAAEHAPVFFCANMSPAIAMLAGMAAQAAKMFPNADIEIIERHHNRKVDVPSGTALLLANAIQSVRPDSTLHVGRSENGTRAPNANGIHTHRKANEVGTHEIIISTGTQTITLKHEAEDRALFAEGALDAARFIVQQPAGLYTMQDMINSQA